MPRRKSAAGAATPISTKSHKRQISSTTTSASRASKRLRSSAENTPTNGKTTPKKSKYFEGSDEDEEPSPDEASESGYEEVDASTTEVSEPPTEAEDEYDSEEDVKPKKVGRRSTGASKGVVSAVIEGGKALWREGVKAGLGPGRQVFIEKPKPRGDGGIKYLPDRIHSNTMAFLADLKKNNDREWLKMHDPDYRQSWNDWTTFVEALSEKIAEIDETVPELPPKDLVFRIYRDIRFSPDPTPYKTHFSAAWSRTGRKGPYACYYVQIQPGGQSFVGSGLWHPEAAPLALLRRNIDRRPQLLKSILTESQLRKIILNVNANDEKKAIKAFTASNAENALKTKPKGYEANHPNIELLKLKNFTIGKRLKDEEIANPEGIETVASLIATMAPFVTYLNSVVMPDEDDASSSAGDEDETADAADADETEQSSGGCELEEVGTESLIEERA